MINALTFIITQWALFSPFTACMSTTPLITFMCSWSKLHLDLASQHAPFRYAFNCTTPCIRFYTAKALLYYPHYFKMLLFCSSIPSHTTDRKPFKKTFPLLKIFYPLWFIRTYTWKEVINYVTYSKIFSSDLYVVKNLRGTLEVIQGLLATFSLAQKDAYWCC